MNIPIPGEENVLHLGHQKLSNQTLPVATIYLQTTDSTKITISVLITSKIAQSLGNLPFSYVKELPHLQDLHLNHVISIEHF